MRSLIDITDFSVEEVNELLDTACDIVENPDKYAEACKGKKLATLFFEPSTRTRLSFTAAMMELGGNVLGFDSGNNTSASKGESVYDTAKMVSCYADIIAMRHPKEGAPYVAARSASIPVINAGMIKTGDEIAKLGEFYAKAYFEKLGKKNAVLYGPAYKGISIAVSAAVALAKNGLDVPFFFNRKEVKDHGEGGVFVGYVPQAGEEVVIVEDVITAGTAIRESMAILSHLEGVKVAATFVMVDRKEKGKGDKGAMAEIEEEFGFPVYSVVDVYDIIEYLEEDEANAENVERIRNYLAVNGAKA